MSAIFGQITDLSQKNGPEVRLRVFGDESYSRPENLDGYTAIYDDDMGLYCYARLSAGRLSSTGTPITAAPPEGLVAHLQESAEVKGAKVNSRREQMATVNGGMAVAFAAGVDRTFGPNKGLLSGRRLATGTVKGLTILVNFQDVTATVSAADVSEMLNGENYTRNGNICSARDYFLRVSTGKLDYTNVVAGPFTLSRNREFYHNNLLVEEALQLAVAAGVDLRQFDSLNAGFLDALNILYAGPSQFRENSNLWPHNSDINIRIGTIRTNQYLLTGLGRDVSELTIGTFCHENGHLLCRFPDMYDYAERDGDAISSAGIGYYCLMGAGNHLGDGTSPSPVSAYLRDLVGWCDNVVNLNNGGPQQAKHGDYNTVLKFRTSKTNEYFLVENRSKMDLDRDLPASGLAVYHCDILGSNELQEGSATRHYQCALLQADGRRDLERDVNQGDGGDLYGAVAGTALSDMTVPNSREWDGRDSNLRISGISTPGSVISFTIGQTTVVTQLTVSDEVTPNLPIPDNRAAGVSSTITLAGSGTVVRIKVSVDIQHPFIGDLRVTLTSPTGRVAILHAQLGGASDDIIKTFDSNSPGVLTNMIGQSITGSWVLNVSDRARQDVGRLRSWRIELSNSANSSIAAAAGGVQP